jgi:hypothetical protein
LAAMDRTHTNGLLQPFTRPPNTAMQLPKPVIHLLMDLSLGIRRVFKNF